MHSQSGRTAECTGSADSICFVPRAALFGRRSAGWRVAVCWRYWLKKLSCIDATRNASMIRGGMGADTELKTESGKLVAATQALYSGLLLLVTAAVVSAPLMRRRLHRFHLD